LERLRASELAREAELKPLLESIRRAAAANPEEALALLRSLDLSDHVQARAYSDFIRDLWFESEQWSSQLVEEFDRVYALCSASPGMGQLFALGSFADLAHFANDSLKLALTQRFLAALDSPHAAVRHTVIRNHSGIDGGASQGAFHAAVMKCLADPDWKVRTMAECYLRDEDALPRTYRPSIADRIRRRFFVWNIYDLGQPGKDGFPDVVDRDAGSVRKWISWAPMAGLGIGAIWAGQLLLGAGVVLMGAAIALMCVSSWTRRFGMLRDPWDSALFCAAMGSFVIGLVAMAWVWIVSVYHVVRWLVA
jgi:hypothetical protein